MNTNDLAKLRTPDLLDLPPFPVEEEGAKALILYHADCIDGFTSAYVVYKKLLKLGYSIHMIEEVGVRYGKEEEILKTIEESDPVIVFIVDFSLSVESLGAIDSDTRVIVLDHHKTAFEMYADKGARSKGVLIGSIGKNVQIVLDMDECGASLCYKLLLGNCGKNKVPVLIEAVKDYDLWSFAHPNTKHINKYLRTQPKTFANWKRLIKYASTSSGYQSIASQGKAIQGYHDALVDNAVDEAFNISIFGKRGLAVNAIGELASDIGHELANRSGTYGAVWQRVKGPKYSSEIKVSLRSNGSYDVEEIAKDFGGGGHMNAAGFTCSWDRFSFIVENKML